MARRGRQGENSALPEKPSGFIDVLRTPTNITSVFARSFAAHTAESKARARAVLNQIGIVAQSRDQPGPLRFDCEASARNKVFPPGLTAEMVAADPDMLRARPVDPSRFWDQLAKALELNPSVSADDAPMAAQARTLLALRSSDPAWRALLDRAALAADAELHDSTRYDQIGVDAGNGWQRQENAGAWGSDWFGRAQAAIVYIYCNDFHEATYFMRGTDDKGALLQGRYRYTVTFPKGATPPVKGFWSLTLYNRHHFFEPNPLARYSVGTKNKTLQYGSDGSLTIYVQGQSPGVDKESNWLPAPADGASDFSLYIRSYWPEQAVLDGSWTPPAVVRGR